MALPKLLQSLYHNDFNFPRRDLVHQPPSTPLHPLPNAHVHVYIYTRNTALIPPHTTKLLASPKPNLSPSPLSSPKTMQTQITPSVLHEHPYPHMPHIHSLTF